MTLDELITQWKLMHDSCVPNAQMYWTKASFGRLLAMTVIYFLERTRPKNVE